MNGQVAEQVVKAYLSSTPNFAMEFNGKVSINVKEMKASNDFY
jgi:hypothetical protein